MSVLWLAVVLAAVVSFAFKAAGPILLGRGQLPDRSRGVIALLAPSLLAALVVVQVLGLRWSAVNGPLLAGLVVAAIAKFLRAPILLAVAAAVVTTAVLRLILR